MSAEFIGQLPGRRNKKIKKNQLNYKLNTKKLDIIAWTMSSEKNLGGIHTLIEILLTLPQALSQLRSSLFVLHAPVLLQLSLTLRTSTNPHINPSTTPTQHLTYHISQIEP